jgi:3-hydroxyisobutyrate dehydrogenase-like beta-hydroxyacid dehydrogenase
VPADHDRTAGLDQKQCMSELVFGPEVLTGRYRTGFALGLMAKDVRIARSVAAAAKTDAPVIALADERWANAPRQPRDQTGLNGRYLWLRTSSVSCVTPGRQPT